MADVRTISAGELTQLHRGLLRGDGTELALVDAREPTEFTRRHLLYAANLPPSHVGLEVAARIPRAGTPVVVCDDGGGEAAAVALELTVLGYTDTAVLDGGIDAWAAAGGELYSGINVPSKLFGELVEEHFGTPHVTAAELDRWLTDGRELVVLDSRTRREFQSHEHPDRPVVPRGELVRRVGDLIADGTTVGRQLRRPDP